MGYFYAVTTSLELPEKVIHRFIKVIHRFDQVIHRL